MYRLFINDEEAEINANGVIQLSKLLLDISDLSSRGINFTNSINLPFTGKNDRLTGFPSRLSSNNEAFERNQKYILTSSNNIVSVGDVVIKSFSEKIGIKIQLAEGFGFWAATGKKLLNDLILHDDDFVFNTVNMDALKVKTGSVFLTALHGATGDGTNTALVNYSHTRPCYYFKNILNAIVLETGYIIDYGDVLDLVTINDIGCLSNSERFFVCDFKGRWESLTVSGAIDAFVSTGIFFKAGNLTYSSPNFTNNLYKTSYILKGWITSTVNTSIEMINGTKSEKILIPKGTSFINFRSDELEIGSVISFFANDTVTLDDVYIYTAINENDIFEITGVINIDDYLVLADYNLPQQTAKVFIKNLLKMFFLNLEINERTKTVTLKYLPSQINANNTIDLSENVDRYFTTKVGGLYGQLNSMSFTNDEEISNELGSAFFNIENKNAKESKEFIKVPEFSASNEIKLGVETIIAVNIYDVATSKRKAIRDRIVYFQSSSFGFNAVFNLISFQRLYSDYYFPFVDATKRERVIELSAFITNLQFRKLQQSPVAYIGFLESNFLITNIKGFEENKKCTLQGIKYN